MPTRVALALIKITAAVQKNGHPGRATFFRTAIIERAAAVATCCATF